MSEVLASRPRPVPPALPPLLSFAAGFIDSFTVLALFGMFVAQVTGSFVLAAAAFVTREQGAVTKVLAIPVFLLAAVVTTSLAIMVERRGRAPVAWALGLECVVMTGFLFVVFVGAPLADPNAVAVVIASLLGLFAMGMQSATVRLLMKNVASTNVMTTNTTQIAIDATELGFAWHARRRAPADAAAAAAYDAACMRLAGLFPVMLAFLLGTAAGTIAYVSIGSWGLLVPVALMYGAFGWASAWTWRRLAHRCRDIAAIDRGHVARGFQFQRLMQECLRHVVGGDLAAEQVAAQIVGLADAARLRALGDETVGQQSGADAIRIDRVGADAVGAVVHRVLPHQEQRRGLGQAVRPEIRSRVHGLLRHVEQQTTAGALREHDFHRRLRHPLVAVEVQLEALSQNRLGDLADPALPGRARVRHHDIDAAERLHHPLERRATRSWRR